MQLENRHIGFITDETEFRVFMEMFMGLVNNYHESVFSKEFDFDYNRFVIEWKSKSLGVFVAYDGDKAVGFILASVYHSFFERSPTWTITHAFVKDEYRGDMDYVVQAMKFVSKKCGEFGCDKVSIITSPELMPLIMSIGGEQVLYSGVEFKWVD